MSVNNFVVSVLITTAAVFSTNLHAQQGIRFYEPGVSITYDTAAIMAYKRSYSTFRIKAEQIEIRVSAEIPGSKNAWFSTRPSTNSELQAYVQNQVVKLTKQPNSFSFTNLDVVDYDKKVQKVGSFLGYGFVELDKKTNKKYTKIFCFHVSENAYTTISLTGFDDKSLAYHYKQLENFVKGFKAYTKAELSEHVSLNEKKYTIVVSEVRDTLPEFKSKRWDYMGVVKTKEKFEDKIRRIYIHNKGDKDQLEENEKGEMYFALLSGQKGITKVEGLYTFLSSIGKTIEIPFSFQFERK